MKQIRITVKVFLFAGLVWILIGAGMFINRVLFLNRAIPVEGTVIGIKEDITTDDDDNQTDITYRPQVQYETINGEVKTFILTFGSNPPMFSKGDKVKVLYDNKRENYAVIDSFLTMWFPQITFILLGTIFLSIALIGLSRLNSGKPLEVYYNVEITGKELLYLLKLRKLCPVCSGKLVKKKEKIDMGDGMYRMSSVEYYYICNNCGKAFPLKQLAGSG